MPSPIATLGLAMRLADLGGRRVVLWGFGREGRATLEALRALPTPPADITIVTDAAAEPGTAPPDIAWLSGDASAAVLRKADVVVRSPGISRYRSEAVEAAAAGVTMTTATDLWFGEHADEPIIGVTGSKGKSTTTSLIAHLLRAAGQEVELAGNIGVPLLGVHRERPPDFWVLELSSHQTSDLTHSPGIGVLLNLYREHIDWHGSLERYISDKLNLFGHRPEMTAVLNAGDPVTREQAIPATDIRWFNAPDGFHVEGGAVRRGGVEIVRSEDIALRGDHNLVNVCAALTAVDAAGVDGAAAAAAIAGFHPLRHRLESVATHGGVEYVNDSIATIPEAAIAACEALRPRPVTLLAGGFDRQQDHAPLIEYLRHAQHVVVVTMPPSGLRLHTELCSAGIAAEMASGLDDAVVRAQRRTPEGGVILLSPAAPSYGLFRDFEDRGDAFRDIARLP